MPPHVGPGWRHRRHMGALPPPVGPGWRHRRICGCFSCSSPFNSLLPRSTRGNGVVEPVVAGRNLLQAMAKTSPSSNGENVVKPKRCRAGRPSASGTSQKVRQDRLKKKIEDLTVLNTCLGDTMQNTTCELAVMTAERDSARTQLKISQQISEARLLMIKNEVPDFTRHFLKGSFDRYRASL